MEQKEIKTKFLTELANVLKQATYDYTSNDALSKESTQILCNTIETLFIHGLKTAFFQKKPRSSRYPEPNFWPFVSKYTHRAVLDQIAASNQIKTEIGKSRAWIRILLNENTIENYLSLLSRNSVTLCKFYDKWAFLRDTECMNDLLGYMKGLSRLNIEAPVNSFSLNTWTPTPLILSGLIVGEPARLKQLVKSRRCGSSLSVLDQPETAENALQSLYSSTEKSSSSCTGESDATGREADESSIYSHPSMLDGENIYRLDLNSAKNAVITNPVPENSILNYNPHQIRVTRGTRRVKRKSRSSTTVSPSSSINEFVPVVVNDSHDLEEVVKKLEDLEEPGKDKQRTDSSVFVKNCKNGENIDHMTEACGEETVNMKEHKSFELDNAIPINGEITAHEKPESCENDFEKRIGSDVKFNDAADDLESKPSAVDLKDESFNRFCSFYPAFAVENEHYFNESSNEIKNISRKSSNVELERSLSMQDDLYVPEHCSEGNSLLGKGWVVHHRWNAEPSSVQTSTNSPSTNADSFPNFNTEIKNEIMNQKHSDSGGPRKEITSFDCDLLRHAGDGDEHSFSTSNHDERAVFKSTETEVDSSGNVQFSDEAVKTLTMIPHEKGLDVQNFRCASCGKSIGPTFASYRKCSFDEKYYCDACFGKGGQSVIPSRLIRNWDARPRDVCKSNMIFIESIRDKPIFDINQINPKLYSQFHALNAVKFLREKLSLSAMYLQSCRQSIAEDFENRIWPKDYLYKDIHIYSITDLLTVQSGYMENYLNSLFNFTTEHIRRCFLCSQKGFTCEICALGEVIYPFQLELTSRCLQCFSMYHKNCLEKERCPKCTRRERYAQQQPNIGLHHLLLDMD